jgi:hypothetical protein
VLRPIYEEKQRQMFGKKMNGGKAKKGGGGGTPKRGGTPVKGGKKFANGHSKGKMFSGRKK